MHLEILRIIEQGLLLGTGILRPRLDPAQFLLDPSQLGALVLERTDPGFVFLALGEERCHLFGVHGCLRHSSPCWIVRAASSAATCAGLSSRTPPNCRAVSRIRAACSRLSMR